MNNVEAAPFRSLDDFLLGSARFQAPEFKDPQRCVNRFINNLIYYQSNYFATVLVIFLIVGVLHPVQMVFGFLSVTGAFALFVYTSNNQAQFRRFKRQYPAASIFIIFLVGYFIIHLFGSVITFLFGIALPMLFVIVHAMLRLRNLKNKVANTVEHIGLKRTPMGLFLEALGLESEAGS